MAPQNKISVQITHPCHSGPSALQALPAPPAPATMVAKPPVVDPTQVWWG